MALLVGGIDCFIFFSEKISFLSEIFNNFQQRVVNSAHAPRLFYPHLPAPRHLAERHPEE
jgi:hypothetical protein